MCVWGAGGFAGGRCAPEEVRLNTDLKEGRASDVRRPGDSALQRAQHVQRLGGGNASKAFDQQGGECRRRRAGPAASGITAKAPSFQYRHDVLPAEGFELRNDNDAA